MKSESASALAPSGNRRFLGGALSLLLGLPVMLLAQTGAIDPTFTPGPIGVRIERLAVQGNGQILVGGNFTNFHGSGLSNLVRLNIGGTVDPVFATPSITVSDGLGGTLNGTVYGMAPLADGKVLVGGGFDKVGGVTRGNLCRLNGNGSLDGSFDVPADGVVWRLAPQPDGTVFVLGAFKNLGGAPRIGLARLRADGSLDGSLVPNLSPYFGGNVHCVAVQSDGKILIGGQFSKLSGGLVLSAVLRLDANGTLDSTFTPPGVPTLQSFVFDLVVQADGKIVVGGAFNSLAGVTRQSIARLTTSGAVDATWPGPGVFSVSSSFRNVKALRAVSGGKILVAGDFEQYNGETTRGIARLNSDGTRDQSLNSPSSNVFRAACMAVQPDGAILLGGTLDTPTSSSLVRLAGTTVADPTLTYTRPSPNVLRFEVPAGFRLQRVTNLGESWQDVPGTSPIDVTLTGERSAFRLAQ